MHFIDECKIVVVGGNGGHGCVAFHREPFNPRGGPSGGDGGNGGCVIVQANSRLTTLLDVSQRREFKAESGQSGQGRDKYGRAGQDITIQVPLGTLVYNEQHELLCDLVNPNDSYVVAQGGKGGKGNKHFATSTYQAPHEAEKGGEGQKQTIYLELKLLAEVGLLGFPNVGKSTFLSRVSAARPKIADYPFTTLVPQLGIASLSTNRSLVIADIPGIIQGAHLGKGLGLQFLRHVERTRVLLHLLTLSDLPDQDPLTDYDCMRLELKSYSAELAQLPEVIALTKADLPEVVKEYPYWQQQFKQRGKSLGLISAASGIGVTEILEKLYHLKTSLPFK